MAVKTVVRAPTLLLGKLYLKQEEKKHRGGDAMPCGGLYFETTDFL